MMNGTTTPNTTSLPLVNLTQTVSVVTSVFNATTLINTTVQPSTAFNLSSTSSTARVPTSHHSELCQTFEYDFHTNIPISIVCGLCFLFGLIMLLVGYRAFRVSMFIMGLTMASVLTYLILENKTKLGLLWTSTISAGAGLFFGLFAASISVVGLIIASILQGLFFMVVVLFVITLFTKEHIFWICVGTLGGLSIIFAIIVMLRQRKAAIVYITSFGAILIMLSVDYFLDLFLIATYAYNLILQNDGRKPCWFSWVLFAIWPFLLALGCCVQFFKTARGYYHSPAEEKKAKESKYKTDSTGRSRRLYDNGDVIAQAWIQTTDDTLDKRRSFTPPVYEYDSSDDKENTTLV